MIMLVLCATLIVAVLPAAAYYNADKPLVTYEQGTINGDMNYTIGNSSYSDKMWSNDSSNMYTVLLPNNLPVSAYDIKGRLYVYWTWSFNDTDQYPGRGYYDTGVNATMNVTFSTGGPFQLCTLDETYMDRKNDTEWNGDLNATMYDYPSGTYAYDVSGYLDPYASDYVVRVNNSYDGAGERSFNIQAVGLLIYYNMTSTGIATPLKYYWVDEGCDITYVNWKNTTETWGSVITPDGTVHLTPDGAVSLAKFENVCPCNVNSANLITCAPSAGTPYNRLYFNYFFNYPAWEGIRYWDGLWNANPYPDFSWNVTDVKNNLICGTNYAGFQNGLYTMLEDPGNQEKQMQAANAFLLITYNQTALSPEKLIGIK